MEISAILDSAYLQANATIGIDSEVYFTIIQIKNEEPNYKNYSQSIYKDIKLFISSYIDSLQQEDFGYDFIDLDKLCVAITMEKSNAARFELVNYCIRKLKSSNHDELADKIIDKRTWFKFLKTIEERKIGSYFDAILIISAYNFYTILTTMLILSCLTTIMLQNAFFKIFELYSFEYEKFSNNENFNKILNIWAKPFGFAEKFKVIPLNEIAVILLIVLKITYFVFIANYLLEKTKQIIKM